MIVISARGFFVVVALQSLVQILKQATGCLLIVPPTLSNAVRCYRRGLSKDLEIGVVASSVFIIMASHLIDGCESAGCTSRRYPTVRWCEYCTIFMLLLGTACSLSSTVHFAFTKVLTQKCWLTRMSNHHGGGSQEAVREIFHKVHRFSTLGLMQRCGTHLFTFQRHHTTEWVITLKLFQPLVEQTKGRHQSYHLHFGKEHFWTIGDIEKGQVYLPKSLNFTTGRGLSPICAVHSMKSHSVPCRAATTRSLANIFEEREAQQWNPDHKRQGLDMARYHQGLCYHIWWCLHLMIAFENLALLGDLVDMILNNWGSCWLDISVAVAGHHIDLGHY